MAKIPKLKRVRIYTEQDLENWVSKPAPQEETVMLVTYNEASGPKHVSREKIRDAITPYGWIGVSRHTLNTHLIGQVIRKSGA